MKLNTRKQSGKARRDVRSIFADVTFHLLASTSTSSHFQGCRNSAHVSVVRESMDEFSVA